MRDTEEMKELILKTAREDERIRAVVLNGSRADPECPRDKWQDYDIVYFVRDVEPFWDNMEWIEKCFGKPSLVQKPESMTIIPPDGNGDFVYLMIFPDGNRIDLTVTADPRDNDTEPAIVLLDKDGVLHPRPKKGHWHIRRPDQKLFSDCCNEFYWCLNNVAKGTARGELPYAMDMFNIHVRDMLRKMLEWLIGSERDFSVSAGKRGKYFEKLLPAEVWARYVRTYSDGDIAHLREAALMAHGLFGDCARTVAKRLGFSYNEEEERAILDYMRLCGVY